MILSGSFINYLFYYSFTYHYSIHIYLLTLNEHPEEVGQVKVLKHNDQRYAASLTRFSCYLNR